MALMTLSVSQGTGPRTRVLIKAIQTAVTPLLLSTKESGKPERGMTRRMFGLAMWTATVGQTIVL
jgi:hypothetical protein